MQPKVTPERDSTDESLLEERGKTDQELARGRNRFTEDADRVVRAARSKADAVLEAARKCADKSAKPAPSGLGLEHGRAREDAALNHDRVAADLVLEDQRDVRSRALAELFRIERDQTDLYLSTERARSDDEVATRDTFLAMVAHDLRAIVHTVALSAQLLERESAAGGSASVGARAAVIRRSTTQMNRLIADLVDVATVETGRPLVKPDGADLARLLREISEGYKQAASAHQIEFTSELVGHPRAAPFDHDRILQVIANLITNAIKFTRKGGQIRLRVDSHEGLVRFAVSDTGAGIPPGMLEAIFERFWQGGEKSRGGLGLGLYISKCIVEGHGGKIRAESVEGQGTTLEFTLPGARA